MFLYFLFLGPFSCFKFSQNLSFIFSKGLRSKRSERTRDNGCKQSLALLHTDLLHGVQSGEFTHHQHARTIDQCRHACCRTPKCDVAYIKNGECYSVDCTDDKSCLWIEAKDHVESSTVVYVRHSATNAGHSKGIVYVFYDY